MGPTSLPFQHICRCAYGYLLGYQLSTFLGGLCSIPVGNGEHKNNLLVFLSVVPGALQHFICTVRRRPYAVIYRSSQVVYIGGLHDENL
jgi:hypothetical protein